MYSCRIALDEIFGIALKMLFLQIIAVLIYPTLFMTYTCERNDTETLARYNARYKIALMPFSHIIDVLIYPTLFIAYAHTRNDISKIWHVTTLFRYF